MKKSEVRQMIREMIIEAKEENYKVGDTVYWFDSSMGVGASAETYKIYKSKATEIEDDGVWVNNKKFHLFGYVAKSEKALKKKIKKLGN